MKKTNLMKVILVLMVSVMLILSYTTVANAATSNNTFDDITNTLDPNSSSSNSSNTNSNSSNTNTNAIVSNSSSTSNSNANNTNNSSVYANSNLPSTGIGQSLPIALLVIVCAISAIYAYKKIKDYRNI